MERSKETTRDDNHYNYRSYICACVLIAGVFSSAVIGLDRKALKDEAVKMKINDVEDFNSVKLEELEPNLVNPFQRGRAIEYMKREGERLRKEMNNAWMAGIKNLVKTYSKAFDTTGKPDELKNFDNLKVFHDTEAMAFIVVPWAEDNMVYSVVMTPISPVIPEPNEPNEITEDVEVKP